MMCYDLSVPHNKVKAEIQATTLFIPGQCL